MFDRVISTRSSKGQQLGIGSVQEIPVAYLLMNETAFGLTLDVVGKVKEAYVIFE